ncbi:hypothetical protein BDF20DRAFT_915173 [Mycotypha africana]|uniref:uncharacterized protein n=1 Tax=Mycotypha africana TaxID=64632 RepID=UPI0023000AF8|nr:uncharacterized protein BDF20DRAFT_915173 [Mycotypha africana]KAI8973770.1 hypothetical protein BDF20DRAFT_915173 [Mycotypha africana]
MAPNYKNKNKNRNDDQPKTPVTTDPRFANVHNDPRFLRPKKKDLKVTIDKRFASMMNSSDFSDAPRVDKYGRPLKKQSAKKELERFYQLEDDDENEEESGKTVEELEKDLAADAENLRDETSESEDEDQVEFDTEDKGYDPMRGRGVISDSDSDESSESDAEVEEEEEEDDLDEIDKIKTIHEGEETSRLALVNMDWDKIKAVDILKVINGFKPDTGVVKSVTIYPSEFGKERMAIEDAQGPPSEIFQTKGVKSSKDANISSSSSDEDEEEITAETVIKNQLEEGDGQDFDQEALRKYQLDRLKYYYAVITCDSPQTAKTIYKSCDGTEYENSANFFDLRYIPEDMTFDDEPKDAATVAPEGYQPAKFKTDALQQTKVNLTWDEDDVNRYQMTRREFTEEDLKELDFDAYLASTDEEEDENEDLDALREKYRKLLNSEKNQSAFEDGHEDKDGDEGDMEITFTPGLSEAAAAAVAQRKEEDEKNEDETTIEKYIRKQKEKKKAKKEKAQQMAAPNGDSEEESDLDDETKNDPYFKEALQEMEKEGFVSADDKAEKKKKKRTRKRASKEEREQKAKERAELELLMGDQAKSDGFDMKEVLKKEKLEKKKNGKKGKKTEEPDTVDNFEIDVSDPRFAAIQESHHFAIDPTNPHFKKTKNMQKLIEARQSKMKEDSQMTDVWKKEKDATNAAEPAPGNSAETVPKSSSLKQLVASVKRKGALDQQSKNAGKRQKK